MAVVVYGATGERLRRLTTMLRELGYTNVTKDRLFEFVVLGITPEFVRDMRSEFGNIELPRVIALKALGVTKTSLHERTDTNSLQLSVENAGSLADLRVGVDLGDLKGLAESARRNDGRQEGASPTNSP